MEEELSWLPGRVDRETGLGKRRNGIILEIISPYVGLKLGGILPFLEYDVDGFLGLSEKIHMAEQVLQTGRAVCSGYAHLCCEMCR